MKGQRDKRKSPPGNETSTAKKAAQESQSQIEKMRKVETCLSKYTSQLDPNYASANAGSGGLEKRLSNVLAMTQHLLTISDGPTAAKPRGSLEQIPTVEKEAPITKKVQQQENIKIKEPVRRNEEVPTLPSFTLDHPGSSECEDFTKYFMLKFEPNTKRKVSSYEIKRVVQNVTGETPTRLLYNSMDSLTIEASTANQSMLIARIENVKGHKCIVTPHPKFNSSQGIIYIMEYDLDDVDEFRREICRSTGAKDCQPAPFLRTRNESTKAFTISFENKSPLTLSIFLERGMTQSCINLTLVP